MSLPDDPVDVYATWLAARLKVMEAIRYASTLPVDSRVRYYQGTVAPMRKELARFESELLEMGVIHERPAVDSGGEVSAVADGPQR